MTPQNITIDPLSTTALRIQPRFNNMDLATATGFTILYEGKNYLITNWHVVTGRDADTDKCLDTKHVAVPNRLSIFFHSSKQLGTWVQHELNLYDDAENPCWIEHPMGKCIDVVAIPLQDIENIKFYGLDLALAHVDMVVMPAMPVSVIGYPLGLTCGEGWPIWKTGHIASDPDIDFQPGRPAFLIDATTREGMSGAPVVIRNTSGLYQTKNGDHLLGGVTTKFIGIYAGRIHKLSEIGRVWRPFLIQEILGGRLFFDAESRRITPNRNTTCPCNRGKRFKECCGSLAS